MNVFRKIADAMQSVYFNFHYLPFKQAIKLPIILHRASLKDVKGGVRIESTEIYRGMIRLGASGVCLYPDNGIVWQNFDGRCEGGAFQCLLCEGCSHLNLPINRKIQAAFSDRPLPGEQSPSERFPETGTRRQACSAWPGF